jgi:hypothetical protein
VSAFGGLEIMQCHQELTVIDIDAINRLFQAILMFTVVIATVVLLVFPNAFGYYAAYIFKELESHGIYLSLSSNGASVTYQVPTDSEIETALTDQSTIDAIASEATCLRDATCSADVQMRIALALGIDSANNAVDAIQDGIAAKSLGGDWVVVFGADQTVTDARDDLDAVGPLGYDLALVDQGGVLRPVAIFESHLQAHDALPDIRKVARREDSYVRLATRWCQGMVVTSDERLPDVPFVTCSATGTPI